MPLHRRESLACARVGLAVYSTSAVYRTPALEEPSRNCDGAAHHAVHGRWLHLNAGRDAAFDPWRPHRSRLYSIPVYWLFSLDKKERSVTTCVELITEALLKLESSRSALISVSTTGHNEGVPCRQRACMLCTSTDGGATHLCRTQAVFSALLCALPWQPWTCRRECCRQQAASFPDLLGVGDLVAVCRMTEYCCCAGEGR